MLSHFAEVVLRLEDHTDNKALVTLLASWIHRTTHFHVYKHILTTHQRTYNNNSPEDRRLLRKVKFSPILSMSGSSLAISSISGRALANLSDRWKEERSEEVWCEKKMKWHYSSTQRALMSHRVYFLLHSSSFQTLTKIDLFAEFPNKVRNDPVVFTKIRQHVLPLLISL